MIFHSTWKDRVAYLIVLVLCVGLVLFTGFQVLRGATMRIGSWNQALAAASLLLALSAWLNWGAYSGYIRVHEGGLEWKDPFEQGRLSWEEIKGIGYKQYPKFAKPGLVLRSTQELKFLPFFSPALYAALRERCGRLPAEVEKSHKFRS
jgi:hypothetical protein